MKRLPSIKEKYFWAQCATLDIYKQNAKPEKNSKKKRRGDGVKSQYGN